MAALCVAVTAVALPAGAETAEAHAINAAYSMTAHTHHGHSHDAEPGDTGHAEQHAADHSHDTPSDSARIVHTINAVPEGRAWPSQPAIATVHPSPGDQPPRSQA